MKNNLLFILLLSIAISCNTYKKAQRDIYSGNFDHALDNMIKKYVKGNIKEKDIVRWAETFNGAYTKANMQNTEAIYKAEFLPESSEKHRTIYLQYVELQSRYDKLKPLLPIKIGNESIAIVHYNYDKELQQSRLHLADALYGEAEMLMKRADKMDARFAYDKYAEVASLVPNYTTIDSKIERAYQKGLTHIFISINNDSRSILPKNLYEDLTYFDKNNKDLFWQKFHTQPTNIAFDYTLELNFREIAITPELVDRNRMEYKKECIDSSEYVKENGKTKRDSGGQPIKIYTKKWAVCKVNQISQQKSVQIQSEFIIIDKFGQIISRVSPIESTFNFKNISYTIYGDEKALDNDFLRKINCQRFEPFPTNEQMIYSCGMELKNRFSSFILSNVMDK